MEGVLKSGTPEGANLKNIFFERSGGWLVYRGLASAGGRAITKKSVSGVAKGFGSILTKWGKKAGINGVDDFFAGTKYSNKVLRQMSQGDMHAFPESVKAFQKNGTASVIQGGDGVTREILKISGNYKGKQGVFEFIKEADGIINHRFFRPTGR